MYCKKCGKLLTENENFCSACGEPVHKTVDIGSTEKIGLEDKISSVTKDFVWDVHTFPGSSPCKTDDISFDWGVTGEFPDIFKGEEAEEEKKEIPGFGTRRSRPVVDWDFQKEMENLNQTLGLEPTVKSTVREPEFSRRAEEVKSESEKETKRESKPSVSAPAGEAAAAFAASFAEAKKEQAEPQKQNAYETIVEDTEKINKFYTLNKKNEEFQRLLDKEYAKIKEGNVLALEQEAADKAVAEKFVPNKPAMDDDLEQMFADQGLETKVPNYMRKAEPSEDSEFEARMRQMEKDDEAAVVAAEMAREAEKKAKREAEEKAAREAREAEEKAKREAEEKAAREAREAEEKAKREAEEKAAREAFEKALKEAEEKATTASRDHLAEMHKARDTFMDELFANADDEKDTKIIDKKHLKETIAAEKAAYEMRFESEETVEDTIPYDSDEKGGIEHVKDKNEDSRASAAAGATKGMAASAAGTGIEDGERGKSEFGTCAKSEEVHGCSENTGAEEGKKSTEACKTGSGTGETGKTKNKRFNRRRKKEDKKHGQGKNQEEVMEAACSSDSNSDDSGLDNIESKGKGIKVLNICIILLAALMAVEIAFICIRVFASGSNLAGWVETITYEVVDFFKGIFSR